MSRHPGWFMTTLRSTAVLVLAMTVTVPAHAGLDKKLRKLLDKGNHEAVVEQGEKYLDSGKAHADDEEVRLLIQRAAYLMATDEDTADAYHGYLREYAASPYDERAREQLAAAVFRDQVRPTDTIDAYRDFREAHPGSSLVSEALVREEELAWRRARGQDTCEDYQRFLEAYPGGHYASAARERDAELAYRSVRQADDVDVYMAFLRQYPGSRFADEARDRSEALAWARAEGAGTIDAYRDFRQAFRTGERAESAYTRELDLSWDATEADHEIEAYRTFELDYPETELALVAEQREWDLYHYQRESYPGELRAGISRAHRLPDGTYRLYLDVTDPSHQFVGGLQQQHFSIYDGGFGAEIVELAGMEQNRPVDVVFVVDISGSMSEEIVAVKDGIIRFADIMKLRSRDLRLGLVTFIEEVFSVNGKRPRTSNALTADETQFQRWVEAIELEQGSEEDHFMALDLASQLPLREDSQRILVLVSDEGPTLRRRFRSPEAIAAVLNDRDCNVYSVVPDDAPMRKLSKLVGGTLFAMTNRTRFAGIMELISQKTSKQYRLVYRRPPEAPPVIDQLQVKVRVRSDYVWLAGGEPAQMGGEGASAMAASAHGDERLYMALATGGLMCSSDGGTTWSVCGDGLPADPVAELVLDPGSPDVVWALLGDGALWLSEDAGGAFTEASLEGGPVAGLVPDPAEAASWLATDGRRLYQRPTTGSWSPAGFTPEVELSALLAHPLAEDILLALGVDGSLWRSIDGGGSATAVADLPWTTAPTGLDFHPQRRGLVFAYGPDGLYRSLDDGATWRSVDLTSASAGATTGVRELLFDPTVRHLILALTDGGVLASDDMGRSWFPQSAGIEESSAAGLGCGAVRPDGRVILGGEGTGLFGMERVANREFVVSDVYFDSGAAEPSRALWPHLDEMAQHLRQHGDLVLRVEGHTDDVGTDESNLELSRERARWVCDYLQQKGVSPAQLLWEGYGESQPLFPNDSRSERARNRRVEMLMIAAHEALPTMEVMR